MSASQDFRQPALCRIYVDDEEVVDLRPYLFEATVETGRGAAAVCTLVFDNFRLEDDSWQVQDAGVFVPWKPFRIEAHFGDYSEEVMRGYVKEVITDAPEQMGNAKVMVLCQDESLLLDREHIRRVWSTEDEAMTDGDILAEIAGSDFDTDHETGLSNVALNQDGTSIRFLRDRAEANGYELYFREGVIHFKPPQLDEDPQASIMAYMGERSNCLRINVRHDGHQPDEVALVRAAETGTELEQETFSPNLTLLGREAASSASMGLAPFVWQMPRPVGSSLEEVRVRAQAKANENAWKIVAEGELDGSLYGHVLLTHKPVGVYGIGETYSGLYYVDRVTHVFAQAGYRQAFRLLRNATGRHTEPEGSDALAGVR
ncbi:MAG: hypothetical protein V5B40_21260 [Candidatus Accumulibacter meliphilus]|jgi:hypothetical protein|uniref:phage late control D family protein n=1 Tax=Candidatus Accumulibacter meliphilus TaxID=2211374 RepID=UPI002FC3AF6A